MRLIDADRIVYSWIIDADGEEHDGVTLQSIIHKMPTVANIPISYIYKVRNPYTKMIGYVTHLIDEVWCNVVWEDGFTESYKHLSKMEVIEG